MGTEAWTVAAAAAGAWGGEGRGAGGKETGSRRLEEPPESVAQGVACVGWAAAGLEWQEAASGRRGPAPQIGRAPGWRRGQSWGSCGGAPGSLPRWNSCNPLPGAGQRWTRRNLGSSGCMGREGPATSPGREGPATRNGASSVGFSWWKAGSKSGDGRSWRTIAAKRRGSRRERYGGRHWLGTWPSRPLLTCWPTAGVAVWH